MIQGERVQNTDKTGCIFFVGECKEESLPELTEMYETFSPKAISQGLPPREDNVRCQWIKKLMNSGINFAVWMESRIVGHAALVIDEEKRDAEYIVFVLAPFRNRGLGSELTAMAIRKAREIQLKIVWLTVEAYNFRAIRVYKKVGFLYEDDGGLERTMLLLL
jgi:RimJ/RimL family protein N-acetyltransferase